MQEQGRGSLGTAALKVLGFLILTALLAVAVVIQQRSSGAYLAEFSATQADEARHFVSGLAMADRLAGAAPATLSFHGDEALRFPVLEAGTFPSLFHAAEGLWFSAVSPATPAALLLPAFLCALLVTGAGWAAGRVTGPLVGMAVGVVLLSAPPLRTAVLVLGLDLPLALVALAAGLAHAAYLTHGRRRDALLFTLAAVAAALTDRAGLALGLVPPLGAILGGRPDLLRKGSLWLPVLAMGLLASPWLAGALEAGPGLAGAMDLSALSARAGEIGRGVGEAFLALAGVGTAFAVARGWQGAPGAPLMGAIAALGVALLLAALLIPGVAPADPAEDTTVVPLLAPVTILAAYGLMGVLGLVTSGWPILRGLVTALALLLAGFSGLLVPVRKAPVGMDEAAQAILARDQPQPVVMVGADAKGESALVAAMAQHDRARRSYVVRASREAVLASAAPDLSAVLARLDVLAVSFLALDASTATASLPAPRGLKAMVAAHPERFGLVGAYKRGDGAGEVRLYSLDGHGQTPIAPAEMKRRLAGAPDAGTPTGRPAP